MDKIDLINIVNRFVCPISFSSFSILENYVYTNIYREIVMMWNLNLNTHVFKSILDHIHQLKSRYVFLAYIYIYFMYIHTYIYIYTYTYQTISFICIQSTICQSCSQAITLLLIHLITFLCNINLLCNTSMWVV